MFKFISIRIVFLWFVLLRIFLKDSSIILRGIFLNFFLNLWYIFIVILFFDKIEIFYSKKNKKAKSHPIWSKAGHFAQRLNLNQDNDFYTGERSFWRPSDSDIDRGQIKPTGYHFGSVEQEKQSVLVGLSGIFDG